MTLARAHFLKAFLDKCPPEKRRDLVECLPSRESAFLDTLPNPDHDPTQGILPDSLTLDQIHPSWVTSYLRTLSQNDMALFLSALPKRHQKTAAQELGFTNTFVSLTRTGKRFLREHLITHVKEDTTQLLPTECLPKSPFNTLLSFTFEEMLQLFDFLGLRDLACDMRLIIEKPKLAMIASLLSKDKQDYLSRLRQTKEPVTFKPMNLTKWEGNGETLLSLIQQRGINRLAKALHNSNPSFLWHLTHALDLYRGVAFQELCTPLENPRAQRTLQEQALEIISAINQKKDS